MKNAGKVEDPLTHKIIGCAMKVHSIMGNGFHVHLAQGLNYLEAFQLDIGLLINFKARSLEFKRLAKINRKNPV